MSEKKRFKREDRHFPESWPINPWLEEALKHRTIRQFTDEPLSVDTIDMLEQLANQAASSTGMQQASWIRITDKALAQDIAKVCEQPYVAQSPELWIFIVDLYRNAYFGEKAGFDMPEITSMNRFFSGFRDAMVIAQSVYSALESIGLGGVLLGSVANDPLEIVKLLSLPKLTFPVLGLSFGYPAESPQLKPRLPLALRRFENKYEIKPEAAQLFDAYDREITHYYDLRENNKRQDSFRLQIQKKYGKLNVKRGKILEDIERQGFTLFVEE